MGLTAFWRRTPPQRMAELLRQEQPLLERAIQGEAYEVIDEAEGLCRVVTDRYTVTFGWMWRERWIDAEIEPHDVSHPLDPYAKYSARSWLEAHGFPTLPRRSGSMSSLLLRDELESVGEVVARILSDERTLRQALFYLAGQMAGYNDRVVVPEQQPPEPIRLWAQIQFRKLSG